MNSSPTIRLDDVLVVVEGPARIIWRDRGKGEWTPVGIWPGTAQRAALTKHLDGGAPLLVLLDDPRAAVPVLREELDRAPQEVLAALCREPVSGLGAAVGSGAPVGSGAAVGSGAPVGQLCDLGEVRVPFLDWLPPGLREQGVEFLAETDLVLAVTPTALLPALLTERRPQPSQVRFARRSTARPLAATDLTAAAWHLFRGSVPVTCPTCPAAG